MRDPLAADGRRAVAAGDEDAGGRAAAAAHGGGVMRRDAAMDLIVQPDFTIRLITAAGKLHAIHAQVAPVEAGLIGVFRIDLRQRDIGPGENRARDRVPDERALCRRKDLLSQTMDNVGW